MHDPGNMFWPDGALFLPSLEIDAEEEQGMLLSIKLFW